MTMQISDILTPDRVLCNVKASSKKRVFEYFSKLLATETSGESCQLTSHDIFSSLLARERLGSTSLGKGVAIPHARVSQCHDTLAAFLQTAEGVDFDAMDQQPVDLIFALVVPEHSTEEHLQILAQLAEMFSDVAFRQRLREAEGSDAKFRLLTNWHQIRSSSQNPPETTEGAAKSLAGYSVKPQD